MTHSDQPYTTWSRVSRKSSRTSDISGKLRPGEHLSPAARRQIQHHQLMQHQHRQQCIAAAAASAVAAAEEEQNNSKSNSMPNLMRRSLMRQSLETGGHCIKVFDLQNSLRSSHSGRQSEGNSFSLVRLFMKQKSLSKEAISLSSSCTSRSHEGACCSSSENQSAVDSSDWPMNSQSDDMEGSASPVHPMRHNQTLLDRNYRRRSGGDIHSRNLNSNSSDFITGDIISPTNHTTNTTMLENDGSLVNNNNAVNAILDNSGNITTCDNIPPFEENVKEVCPCSKPPVTSPIREEPEGMDISFDSRSETKLINDQSETETKSNASLSSVEITKTSNVNASPSRAHSKELNRNTPSRNPKGLHTEERQRSKSPGTPKRTIRTTQRQRQDSGNSSSGYASTKGSTEKIRRSSDSSTPHHTPQRPRPKPRALKQMSDQCLQTSNLKVSATMNTSNLIDRKDVYVYYPNYALPDLSFLKDQKYNVDARIFLVPQHYNRPPDLRKIRENRTKRPFSCNDMEKLRKRGLSHVKDWDSLNVLLPKELKEMLSDNTDCMETVKPTFCCSPRPPRRPMSCDFSGHRQATDIRTSGSNSSLNSTQPSSGYRGSSTMLNDSEDTVSPEDQANQTGEHPPPLPKRSVSLPFEDEEDGETPPPRPPLPRGILRKTTSLRDDGQKLGAKKRHSAADSSSLSRDDALKRRSLQEPMESLAKRAIEEAIPELGSKTGLDDGSAMGCSCVANCTGFCGKSLKKKNILRISELPDISSHEEFTEQDLAALRTKVSNFLVGKTAGEEVCDLCPKKSVTFAEKKCTHQNNQDPTRTAGADSDINKTSATDERPLVYDAQDKKTLVMSVRAAVEKLVNQFSQGHMSRSKQSKYFTMRPDI